MGTRAWLVSGFALVAACAAGSTGTPGTTGGSSVGGAGGAAANSTAANSTAASSTVASSATASSAGGGGGAGGGASATASSSVASSSVASSSVASSSVASSSAASSSVASSSSSVASSSGSDAGPVDAAVDAPSGPVAVGSYTYTAIPTSALFGFVNPPAVAWHPSGSYALVLNETNTVFRYDPVAKALTQVASVGSTIAWSAIRFTPDGSTAVLLGNVIASPQGEIFLWSDATSTLTQMTGQSFAGGTYEAIAWSPDGTQARLLGSTPNAGPYSASLWLVDPVTGRSGLKATDTGAGCQDLGWATDGFNQPVVAVTCGLNGVSLFYLDIGGNIVNDGSASSAGNVSHIAARPQGDYALVIGWSGPRVYRFQQGAWNTSFSSPVLLGIFTAGFSTSGTRALILGGYGGAGIGQVYEFRDDLMQQTDFTDVSIPGFSGPPYNADTNARLNDVAWRPGCDGGLIVGGDDTVFAQHGYVIRFSVDNGVTCPN